MARIVNKALQDDEGILLAAEQDPQAELEALLQGFGDRGCTIAEESLREHTVTEANGQFVGIFYIED